MFAAMEPVARSSWPPTSRVSGSLPSASASALQRFLRQAIRLYALDGILDRLSGGDCDV